MQKSTLAFAFLALTHTSVWSQAPFTGTPIGFGDRSDANALAVADINGDGHLDVIIGGGQERPGASLWLNDGRGALIRAPWVPSTPRGFTLPGLVLSVAVGDVNQDGYVDVILGTNLYVRLYRNNAGTLDTRSSWPEIQPTVNNGVGFADMDGDGDLDVVTANGYTGSIAGRPNHAFINDGGDFDGVSVWTSTDTVRVSIALAVADVNGDGLTDVVFGNLDGPNRLYLGSSTSLLEPAFAWEDAETMSTTGLAIGDITGDGFFDLVCANGRFPATMHVGDGSAFSPLHGWQRALSATGTDKGISLGDVDLDGDLDVGLARALNNEVYINTAGVLDTIPWKTNDNWTSSGVVFADLDGEGDLEMIACGDYQEAQDSTIAFSGSYYINRNAYYPSVPGWQSESPRSARDVELCDTDLDGDLDLFVAHYNEKNYLYHFSGGTFSPAPDWSTLHSGITNDAAFADMDGDGDPDLLCGQDSLSTIYRNDYIVDGLVTGGQLTPDSVWWYDNRGEVTAVAWGDFWHDGYPDPVFGMFSSAIPDHIVENSDSTNGEPRRGTPSTAIWKSQNALRYSTYGLIAAPTQYPGILNLLVSTRVGTGVYPGDRVTGRPAPQSALVSNVAASYLESGYFNSDDRLDLLLSPALDNDTNRRARVFVKRGGFPQDYDELGWRSPGLTYEARAGDVDADGRVDVVCTTPNGNSTVLEIYRNRGGEGFTISPVQQLPLQGPAVRYMKVGDIDADGDLDVVMATGDVRGEVPSGQTGRAYAYFSRREPAFKRDFMAPADHLPVNAAVLRRVVVTPVQDNQREVTFSLYGVESDLVRVTFEYDYEGGGVWRQMQLTSMDRVFASSPIGESHAVTWDVTELELRQHPVTIRLQATAIPKSVGFSSQHVGRYLKRLGIVEPRRAALSVKTPQAVFPTVTVGDTVTADVCITNTGNQNLDIYTVVSEMELIGGAGAPVAPGEADTLRLQFAPLEVVTTDEIVINSNDPLHPVTTVPVSIDVRGLSMTTTMVASPGPLPIEDAVTVIVHPLQAPRIERGFLVHRPAGQQAFLDSVELDPFGDEDLVGVIPDEALFEAGLEYYVRLENSGVNGYDPPGAPGVFFSREVAAPTTVRAEAFPNDGQRFGQGRPIQVQATLPPGSEFQQGRVYYREGASASWDTLAMSGQGALASAEIPGAVADSRGVEYWLEVQTIKSPSLTAPALNPETAPYVIRTTLSNLEEPRAVGGGYRAVSFPAQLEGTVLGAIADDVGGVDDTRWRLWAWNGQKYVEYKQGSERFEHGTAYFFISRDPSRLDIAPITALSVDSQAPFEKELTTGWNLVGNPFPFDVAWSDVIRDTMAVPGLPQRYTGQEAPNEYADATVLKPFSGYWVHNDTDSMVSIRIPPIEHTGAAPTAPLAPLTWAVHVSAQGKDGSRPALWLGVSDRAEEVRDGLDRLLPPPAPETPVDLYALGEGGETLSRDARSASMAPGWGNAWSFDVAVAKNGRVPVTLAFGFDAVPEGAEVLLLDREVKRTHDLTDGLSVEVYVTGNTRKNSPDDTRFVLLVGDAQYIEEHRSLLPGLPGKTALHQNFPNPFNPTTVIRYELAHPGRVSLKIYDVRGALVRTLVDGDKAASRYEVGWDGVDNRGSQVASGIYFYRLLSSEGVVLTRKMVLLK